VFIRENADEAVLVLAARTDVEIRLDMALVGAATAATSRYAAGTVELLADDGAVRLHGRGASFAVWTLPGVTAPPARAERSVATPEAFAQLGGPAV
jgi:alpha-glucosidase